MDLEPVADDLSSGMSWLESEAVGVLRIIEVLGALKSETMDSASTFVKKLLLCRLAIDTSPLAVRVHISSSRFTVDDGTNCFTSTAKVFSGCANGVTIFNELFDASFLTFRDDGGHDEGGDERERIEKRREYYTRKKQTEKREVIDWCTGFEMNHLGGGGESNASRDQVSFNQQIQKK